MNKYKRVTISGDIHVGTTKILAWSRLDACAVPQRQFVRHVQSRYLVNTQTLYTVPFGLRVVANHYAPSCYFDLQLWRRYEVTRFPLGETLPIGRATMGHTAIVEFLRETNFSNPGNKQRRDPSSLRNS
jgi:hypothetical protein